MLLLLHTAVTDTGQTTGILFHTPWNALLNRANCCWRWHRMSCNIAYVLQYSIVLTLTGWKMNQDQVGLIFQHGFPVQEIIHMCAVLWISHLARLVANSPQARPRRKKYRSKKIHDMNQSSSGWYFVESLKKAVDWLIYACSREQW